MHVRNVIPVLVLSLAAMTGCSKGADEPAAGASQGNEAPPPPATGTTPMNKLSDGQIAQILTTVDDAEIEQAQLALKKARDPEIQAFANHMIEQHTASKQAGAQLVAQSQLHPTDSPKAQELQQAGAQMMSKLNAADENNFDITYIDGQIEEHNQVLTLIKAQLLPVVNDTGLRNHLNNAQAMVEQHIQRAQQIKK
jgi:putative membrane protein